MKEVFLSYHHEDKKIAAEVKSELEKSGLTGFLAHDDIKVSKMWRDEILKHLDSCSALMAIVTEHFANSVWVNQEVGSVMAQDKPIVSLMFAGSQALPGFLEMYQGIVVTGIKEAVQESLEVVAGSPEWSNAANAELEAILNKFVNRWELYKGLSENERWMPHGPYEEILKVADQYAEQLFESLTTNQNVLNGEIVNQVKIVFSQMKQFARSQIMTAGRSDYEEMDKRGDTTYDSAKTLLGTLKAFS